MSILPAHFESLYPENACETEIEALVSYIKEGNSAQLIGLPGVGRSHVSGFLSYNKGIREKHFPTKLGFVHFVNVNFSEIRERELHDVMKFLFLSLSSSLKERGMKKEHEYVAAHLRESLSYQDELVLTQTLKGVIDFLCLEQKLTIIFLCDRFEEYVPRVNSAFFANLRALRDRAKYRLSYVFFLSHPLEENLGEEMYSDFSDFVSGHHVFMRLSDPVSVSFRREYLEKLTQKKVDEKVYKELLVLTGGHVRLMKIAMESILSQQINSDNLEQFLLQQTTILSALKSIKNALRPEEITALKEGEENVFLEKVGLLKGKDIQIPLLKVYLLSIQDEKEKIILDLGSQNILKGSVVLSDTLTRAELRLLRYLLEHEGEIVERDTIVKVVWGDVESTEGVSEQAIDQLLFRLRHKLETDPAHPDLIQTVKGRGVKFLQS